DGCALYEAVAVIFIAQINSVQLRFDEIITVRDRIRTSLNVFGDGFAASVVETALKKEDDVSRVETDLCRILYRYDKSSEGQNEANVGGAVLMIGAFKGGVNRKKEISSPFTALPYCCVISSGYLVQE
ncbi:hypothetical protein ANCDUO_02508, partial [Ancylostoma duodenale]